MILYRTLLTLLLLPVLASHAQDTLAQPRKEKPSPDIIAVDLTMDRWLETPPGIEQRTWSPGISLSVFKHLNFGRSPLGVAAGLVFSSHNVHHNGTFTTQITPEKNFYTQLYPRTEAYKKNKASANYLGIPLEFRIVSRGDKPFRLHAGAKGELLMNFHTKTIDEQRKVKEFDRRNVEDYRYGAYARLGWNHINLYGYYGLSTLFREGRGDELVPVSVGISLTL